MIEQLAAPLVAWRRADLRLDDHPRGPFLALTSHHRFGLEGPARCLAVPEPVPDHAWDALAVLMEDIQQDSADQDGTVFALGRLRDAMVVRSRLAETCRHEVPHLNCRCGWYAMERREDVPGRVGRIGTMNRQGEVLLQVELSGRIIRHEYGHRAEYQRVIAVYLSPRPSCGHVAMRTLNVLAGALVLACGRCHPHYVNPQGNIALADVAGELGVEVMWGTDDDWPDRTSRSRLRARAYQQAQRNVRDLHRDHFDELHGGVRWCYPTWSTGYTSQRAMALLRECHRAEFDEWYADELAAYGLATDGRRRGQADSSVIAGGAALSA